MGRPRSRQFLLVLGIPYTGRTNKLYSYRERPSRMNGSHDVSLAATVVVVSPSGLREAGVHSVGELNPKLAE